MADNDALLLKIPEAARLLDISRGLAYELVARGELPSIRLGRVIRIPRHSLEQWINRRAQEGLPAEPPESVEFAREPPHQSH